MLAILGFGVAAALLVTSWTARAAKPDANASRAAFLQVYRVLTSPRCQNCHPAGDAPLQGDNSHLHLQNVKRSNDGHGVYGMRCDTCYQATNLPGGHMPPGNPKWGLPSPEHKMVLVGRLAGELCKQTKDPKQNGGRSLEELLHHIADDDLVEWGWSPGEGRTLPPLSRADTVAQPVRSNSSNGLRLNSRSAVRTRHILAEWSRTLPEPVVSEYPMTRAQTRDASMIAGQQRHF